MGREIVQINGPVTYTAPAGTNPITVASGVDAKIIINGSVTLNGANASGTTGATAAIYVPSSSTLTIYSAHDEYLSTRGDAPQDTLTLKGGDAAAGDGHPDRPGYLHRAGPAPCALLGAGWETLRPGPMAGLPR